jgi:multidrug efflux system membrane fusion protein
MIIRAFLVKKGRDRDFGPRALAYPSLAVLIALLVWLIFSLMNSQPTGLGKPRAGFSKNSHQADSWTVCDPAHGSSQALWCGGGRVSTSESDDAVVTAPVIGIAPRVSGPIASLPVANDARVAKGDTLFEIDPEPYRLAVDVAAANLAAVDGELDNMRGLVASQKDHVLVALAAERKAEVSRAEAVETYERLLPLLAKKYETPEKVDAAKRAVEGASASLEAAQAEVSAARSAVQSTTALEARRAALASTLEQARLALRDCTVRSPVDALVTGMDLSVGAFPRVAVDTFKVIDTGDWAVTARFREDPTA